MAYNIINKVSSSRVPDWGNKHQFIAIHYLGCVGQNYDLAPDGCGAHFTIYWDGTIYQRCSYDAVPWAVGTAGYYKQLHPKANNYNTISIEFCCKCDGDSRYAEDPYWYFTTETQEAGVWLVQKLMKDLNIPIENVLRHADIVNKLCPPIYVKNTKYKTSWTWDEFKSKVAGNKITTTTSSASTQSISMTYFVRKTWEDKASQIGAYTVLSNAKLASDRNAGYKVFDANGKLVYPTTTSSAATQTSTSSTTNVLSHKSVLTGTKDNVWMGWLKRESGSRGYRCTNGDSGHAQGAYQFDNRYALVPFMQYCVDKFPTHYDGFKKYIAYGAGSSSLVGNTSLASLWTSYCDKYWDEFCSLQDSYAYTKYFLEAKKYINNLYGINMDNHSPAVKGTLWSMAIRSGSLTGARKFEGCTDKTSDEEMLRIAYSKYGYEDASRWTKAGQYGDALNALYNNEYTEITVEGTSSPSTTTQTTTTATTSHTYRVRKSWSDASSQLGAYSVLDNAKKICDQNTGYKVFDENGKQVYPATSTTSSTQTTTTTSKFPYMVQVTADVLNVRSIPHTSGSIMTQIKDRGKYTIVAEEDGWGLLKSYESKRNGWISLNYTKKI